MAHSFYFGWSQIWRLPYQLRFLQVLFVFAVNSVKCRNQFTHCNHYYLLLDWWIGLISQLSVAKKIGRRSWNCSGSSNNHVPAIFKKNPAKAVGNTFHIRAFLKTGIVYNSKFSIILPRVPIGFYLGGKIEYIPLAWNRFPNRLTFYGFFVDQVL